jgi:tetratricopeptide (TPR) repeat protein
LDYVSAIETILSLNDSTSYEVNLRLGWLSYKASQKKKSLNYYYKAIQLMPKAIEPRYGYGFPAYLLEDYSDLIEQDKKILEIDPNSKTINGNLGSIYYYSKEYKKALPYFEKVVSLYPFDYDNNLMLGWTNLKLGKNNEAEKYFNVVLLYSPKDASAKEGLLATKNIVSTNEKTLAAFYKSYELSEKSDQKGAINTINEVYDASSYFINLRLGWLNYLAGMQPESVKYYKIACDLMPGSFSRTVNVLFNSKTPCFAQFVKLPLFGMDKPKSDFNSLKILANDGGILTPLLTEKLKPCAWFAP